MSDVGSLEDEHFFRCKFGSMSDKELFPSLQRPLKEWLTWWCSVNILSKTVVLWVKTIRTTVVRMLGSSCSLNILLLLS